MHLEATLAQNVLDMLISELVGPLLGPLSDDAIASIQHVLLDQRYEQVLLLRRLFSKLSGNEMLSICGNSCEALADLHHDPHFAQKVLIKIIEIS